MPKKFKLLEKIFRKIRWAKLCGHLHDTLLARAIVEHLEKTYPKDKPLDIDNEMKKLDKAQDTTSVPLGKYFYNIKKSRKDWQIPAAKEELGIN